MPQPKRYGRTKQPIRWWQHRLRQLKEGKIDNFFDALNGWPRTHNTDAPDISPKRLLQYFQENRDRFNLPLGDRP